jgi:hypothetical protein
MTTPTLDRRAFLGGSAGLTLGILLPAATRLDAATGAAPATVTSWRSAATTASA